MEKALDAYEDFLAFYEKLRLSQCTALVEFLQDTLKHWFNVLKDTVSRWDIMLASIAFEQSSFSNCDAALATLRICPK